MAEATFTGFSAKARVRNLMANRLLGTLTVCAATDPTTSYAALGDYVYCGQADYASLRFTSAFNSATSFEYYVEWSYDASTWFRSINVATSTSTNTLTLNNATITVGGAAIKWIDTFKVQDAFMRLVAKRTGGAASDTLAVACDLLGL